MLSGVILFVIAIGIIALGAYCVIDGLLWSDRPSVNFVVVGLTIGTAGWYILWAVFIAPMFGIEAE
jgi:hypothetical protein